MKLSDSIIWYNVPGLTTRRAGTVLDNNRLYRWSDVKRAIEDGSLRKMDGIGDKYFWALTRAVASIDM